MHNASTFMIDSKRVLFLSEVKQLKMGPDLTGNCEQCDELLNRLNFMANCLKHEVG